jgi:hypothetical protein
MKVRVYVEERNEDHTGLNSRYRSEWETLTTVGSATTKRERSRESVNLCISHVREAILRPAEWAVLCVPSCVGVPANANGGAGVVDEAGLCVPKPLAHSALGLRSRRDYQGQQERKRAPSIRDGDLGDPCE